MDIHHNYSTMVQPTPAISKIAKYVPKKKHEKRSSYCKVSKTFFGNLEQEERSTATRFTLF